MSKALILGSTGLVGSFILSTLKTSPSSTFSSIEIIARRSPAAGKDSTVPVNEFVEKDTTRWAGHLSSISPAPSVVFSGLATTRAAAGGFENQYKIEHDLNIELATAAKAAGTKTYMKGEIEEHIKEIGFEHTIIVQPGLIIGHREESRFAEGIAQGLASAIGKIHGSFKDSWAQDADVIAKAAVSAAIKVEKGEVKDKVWVLKQKDIIQLGSKEWTA
ncbi:Protein fmp52-1, mitochondrial [Cladophialophora carrionii]|uniref:Protein fmp52-1, mitochondrial n=1 Tax=Cladophialophora carrionii TaxID=86049 RepID=A0A1C1CYC5_9EURO|nr:Protein fmp52-1, mitochondrial [Cladophialophora carrionii]